MIEGGAVQGRVRVTRVMTAPVPVTVGIDLSGQAAPAGGPNPDHTLAASFLMTLATNATSVDATFTASVDTILEGWETMIFAPIQYDPEIVFDYGVRYMAFIRENVANPEGLPQGDGDLDGLPDRWELANGLDPFTAGDDLLDPDKDGLTTGDEFAYNTNPKQNDSDGDGENDFFDAHKIGSPDEFLPVRLVTHDTGKVPNAMMNCAECHTTQLRVGDFSQISRLHNSLTDRTVYLRKGTNYPIHLNRVVRHLPRPNAAVGSPTLNTAKYTANIVPHQDDAPRAFVIQDPQSRLGTNKLASNFPPDPSVAIGSLIVPKIEVTFTNLSGNTPLDANTNWGGGVRVFPDALNPNDFTARNAVTVVVRTTPPLAGQAVRLRAIDVDDPNPADMNPGGVLDPNDTILHLPTGNDNRGTPQSGQLAQTSVTLDSQGRATTTLTVTKQPGDNFRIAAVLDTPGAQAHLDQLQVSNPNTPLYVTPDTNAIAGFVGGLSPMLTVWRKLHLEFDSMAAPASSGAGALFESATILQVKPNYPSAGRSTIKLRWPGTSGGLHTHERGKLEISGVAPLKVLDSWAEVGPQAPAGTVIGEVVVDGLVNTSTVGASAKLYDDDEQYLADDPLYRSILGLQSPALPMNQRSGEVLANMQASFASAYIRLVDANAQGWNSQQIVSFMRNASPFSTVFDSGNLQLKGTDRADFWAFSVVFGYQARTSEDGDPDVEIPLSGGTPKSGPLLQYRPFGYSVGYVEDIRDYEFGIRPPAELPRSNFFSSFWGPRYADQYLQRLYSVVAHELGHAPGQQSEAADHAERHVMVEGALNSLKNEAFAPKTIGRFRRTESWTRD